MGLVSDTFHLLLQQLLNLTVAFYADRLISVVVFGSVGRGTMRPDSDIDLLIVADPLPKGRLRRVGEFDTVEQGMEAALKNAREAGIHTRFSPVFKTPEELKRGSALFLDMVDDARILFDREGLFQHEMDRLRERLKALGAKRIWKGNAWYWVLKPDYKWGDEFEI